MEDHNLHRTPTSIPATTGATTTTATTSTSLLITRLVFVALVAVISLWANHEASKGFEITIINDTRETQAGRRFNLMFVANDKATRIVLSTSEFVERILYPSERFPKKPIGSVTLRLAGWNLTHMVVVNRSGHGDYVLYISAGVMAEKNVQAAMASAVLGGMARVWLWDGHNGAPSTLLDGMVDYISILAGFTPFPTSGSIVLPESDGICWADLDRVGVARFLLYCEGRRHDFLARLNQAMHGKWHMGMVDGTLALPSQQLCVSNYSSVLEVRRAGTSNSTSASRLSQVI